MKEDLDEEKLFLFIDKIVEISKSAEIGKSIEFECPICKGEATLYISPGNKHKHANCKNCEATLCE